MADEVEGNVSGCSPWWGSRPTRWRARNILLSNLIHHAWSSGHGIDLAGLVGQVQDPPLRKLGVYELDDFYPAKERSKLAITLNGLLASHSFAAWAEGPDIDLDRLLRAQDGDRPACAIVSLSHLSDQERQFVVSLLLGKLITWMRRQPGTDRLRVLVYFDEVMGFVPPIAMPPAKKPILTCSSPLRLRRGHGAGHQNPVDVDYKGLANAGTWMIGRLQTEQDKARLLDGLSFAGGTVDIKDVGDVIGLGRREFMMREPGARRRRCSRPLGHVVPPGPAHPRADLDAHAGPLPAEQPTEEATTDRTPPRSAGPTAGGSAPTAPTSAEPETVPVAPPIADDVPVRWLAPDAPWAAQVGAVPNGTKLAPSLATRVSLLYDDDKLDLRETEEWEAVLFLLGATVDPAASIAVDHDDRDLRTEAPSGATYVLTDAPLDRRPSSRESRRPSSTTCTAPARCRSCATRLARRSRGRDARGVRRPVLGGRRRGRRSGSGGVAGQVRGPHRQGGRPWGGDGQGGAGRGRRDHPPPVRRGRGRRQPARRRARRTRSARTMARDMGRVLTGQGRRDEAAQAPARPRTAHDRQEALTKLEADLAGPRGHRREVGRQGCGDRADRGPLERSDIRVTARCVVWIPVG